MKIYNRSIKKQIIEACFKGKAIIIYGARQVGKTTLAKQIIAEMSQPSLYFDGELLQTKEIFESDNLEMLKKTIGDNKLVVIDEAQNIQNIGKTIKILVDHLPSIQIIATGSSSFELANKLSEPMTGRARRFTLYPLSLSEISENENLATVNSQINNLLIFGSYPEVFAQSESEATAQLEEIASNYLYRDLLIHEGIRKSDVIVKMLQALALQLGNEVSYHELAQIIGINVNTVQKYLDILEKSFICFKLRAFSRNLRKEISKSIKVYFYDVGIRNALIRNFNSLSLRNDQGALWENFCILERLKINQKNQKLVNTYFWRTYTQQEIDYLEESGGTIKGFEFKFSEKKYHPPKIFLASYPGSEISQIHRANYWKYLM
jgi:predicted AAA+ superfamily ATPase